MDINLPLILMIAVGATGFVWLIDALFLAKSRRLTVANIEQQFAHLPVETKQQDPA